MKPRFRQGERVRLLRSYLGEYGLIGHVDTVLPFHTWACPPYYSYIVLLSKDRKATYREDELVEVDVVTRLGDLARD